MCLHLLLTGLDGCAIECVEVEESDSNGDSCFSSCNSVIDSLVVFTILVVFSFV